MLDRAAPTPSRQAWQGVFWVDADCYRIGGRLSEHAPAFCQLFFWGYALLRRGLEARHAAPSSLGLPAVASLKFTPTYKKDMSNIKGL